MQSDVKAELVRKRKKLEEMKLRRHQAGANAPEVWISSCLELGTCFYDKAIVAGDSRVDELVASILGGIVAMLNMLKVEDGTGAIPPSGDTPGESPVSPPKTPGKGLVASRLARR